MKNNIPTAILAAAVFAVASSSAAQSEERFNRTLDVGETGELSLANVAGDIHVEGGSGSQIVIEAVKRLEGGGGRELLDNVEIDVSQTGDRVRVETRHTGRGRHRHSHGNGGVAVDYRVKVPRGTEVDLHSVSGDVTLVGVGGGATLQSVSGDVSATDVGRLVEAKSVSGDVVVKKARSTRNVDIASVSGEVQVDDIEAPEISVSSVSGDVTLNAVTSERATLESVSGEIRYTGRIAPRGRYDFQSHSGNVVVTIGDDVGFALEASTFSGDIDSELPLESTSAGRRGRRLSGVFGDGSAAIEAQTFSGNVRIRKR